MHRLHPIKQRWCGIMGRYLLIASVVLFVLLLIVAIVVYEPFAVLKASQDNRVTIANETEALQVGAFKIVDRDLMIELKNGGDRPVIAYAFDSKSKKGVTVDLTYAENAFPPGSIHYLRVPIDNLQRAEDTDLYKLNFSLALFVDGTAEGDWEQAHIQREKLEGAALALNQIQSKIIRIKQFSVPAIERLSSELGAIAPSKRLTKLQKVGYQSAVLQALVKTQIILRSQSQEKAGRSFNDFKNSFARQISRIRILSEGRQN